ncbi:BON domain-containing protein [Trichocoleus sp. FACHB-90]|uniref:OmpA family protein n=1 Tax=Cyanophyceae TaxID=3028117 RepID=UPI001683202D|nr:OmpA family protein [Trichocoleus sp. FACHB-90]MBD1928853.1 BON domain-containing protein [Trichocoleus sp. FACHB-90]
MTLSKKNQADDSAPLEGLLNLLIDLELFNPSKEHREESKDLENKAEKLFKNSLLSEQNFDVVTVPKPSGKSPRVQASDTIIEQGEVEPPNFRSQAEPGNEINSISSEEDELDISGDVVTSFSHLKNLIFPAPLLKNQAEKSAGELLPSTDVVTAGEPIKEAHYASILSEDNAKKSSEVSNKSQQNLDNVDAPDDSLARLENLLVDIGMGEYRHLIVNIEQKLKILENQIYEPTELINLLLPLITEILILKIEQSKEEVVEAIAPIMDRMIESRAGKDKVAMAGALAPLISAAISRQISDSPEEIAKAIAPTMGKAIKEQIYLERDSMVDALYPIIGSTISKYMVEEIRAINEKIENTLSVEGITRKIRAKVQGVSEAELILKDAMPFNIRAIFLIHKSSGLILCEVQPPELQKLESDMVAGMLTAIRSFVNDCIALSGEVSELDHINYGASKIILEVAGYCYMAVVVQGEPPNWLMLRIRSTLSSIIQKYGKPIEMFNGDAATIPEQVNHILEDFRDSCTKSNNKKAATPTLLILGSMLLSFILLPWGIYQYRHRSDRAIEQNTALALASNPELAVYRLTVDADAEILKLAGKVPNEYLRQKAAQIAQDTNPTLKLNNNIIAINTPPDPVLPAAEVKRVTSILNQMDGVFISAKYNAGKVTVQGTALQATDAQKITLAFGKIPAIESVTNTVEIQPSAIATRIYFSRGTQKLEFKDIKNKILPIRGFLSQYPEKHLMIVGYGDASDNPNQDRHLALERAKTVRDALIEQGVAPRRLRVAGMTTHPLDVDADQPLWLSRCVEFELVTPVVQRK